MKAAWTRLQCAPAARGRHASCPVRDHPECQLILFPFLFADYDTAQTSLMCLTIHRVVAAIEIYCVLCCSASVLSSNGGA